MNPLERQGHLPEARFESFVPKNRIVELSERFRSVFPDLHKGQQAEIPLMAVPAGFERAKLNRKGSLGAIRAHQRNGHLMRVISEDPTIPTYFSIKGALYYFNGEPVMWEKGKHYSNGIGGLADKDSASLDWKWATELRELGVDVAEPVAIIELLELPFEKKQKIKGIMRKLRSLVPVAGLREELTPYKKDGSLSEEPITPAAYIRAYVCGTRFEDLLYLVNYDGVPGAQTEVRAAMAAVERKHSIKIPGIADYESWIAERIGRNMGIMHKRGLVHGFTHYGNFTLAGELVDLDSVYHRDSVPREKYEHDRKEDIEGGTPGKRTWFGAKNQLVKLQEYLRQIFPDETHLSEEQISSIFLAAYERYNASDSADERLPAAA